jgi:hypothetical protein
MFRATVISSINVRVSNYFALYGKALIFGNVLQATKDCEYVPVLFCEIKLTYIR